MNTNMNSQSQGARNFLLQVTPVVLTFNEAPNIRRSLEKLRCFQEVLVVDSGSSDGTLEIVADFPNTRVVSRPFDSFAAQWNFALREGGLKTDWALAMDADYILTDEFIDELGRLDPSAEVSGYRVSFSYCVLGRRLSSTLYPPITALHRHRQTSYVQDGHCMRAQVAGKINAISSRIMHDDRKPLARWLMSQARYAEEEANLLLDKSWAELSFQDRIRRMIVVAPWLVPLYSLTAGRGIIDGLPGIFYAIQRAIAEAVLSLKLLEALQLRKGAASVK